jgi:DNA polymerase III alpha subunit (gram-positive type)
MKNNLIVLDVETGGMLPTENPITQIAWQAIDPLKYTVLHSFDTFVKPYNNLVITPKALAASRVTMKEVNAGVDVRVVLKEFVGMVKVINKSGKGATKPIIVGHNVGFDIDFLVAMFNYLNKDLFDYTGKVPFDTLLDSKRFEAGKLKSDDINRFTLSACCERFNIPLKSAHGAPADVEATKQLFIKITDNLRNNGSTKNSSGEQHQQKRQKQRDSFAFEI